MDLHIHPSIHVICTCTHTYLDLHLGELRGNGLKLDLLGGQLLLALLQPPGMYTYTSKSGVVLMTIGWVH